jgi:hypothetical protein
VYRRQVAHHNSQRSLGLSPNLKSVHEEVSGLNSDTIRHIPYMLLILLLMRSLGKDGTHCPNYRQERTRRLLRI